MNRLALRALGIAVLLLGLVAMGQAPEPPAPFEITVLKSSDQALQATGGLRFVCRKGCAWREVSFVGVQADVDVWSCVEAEDTRKAADIATLNVRIARIVARQAALRTEIDAIVADLEGNEA